MKLVLGDIGKLARKKKKGKKKEMTNSLGMWCIGRILDQTYRVLRAAALNSNTSMDIAM